VIANYKISKQGKKIRRYTKCTSPLPSLSLLAYFDGYLGMGEEEVRQQNGSLMEPLFTRVLLGLGQTNFG